MLGNRVNDLEARLATQGKLLAEREYENNQLRQTNEDAERTVTRTARRRSRRYRTAASRRSWRNCAARRPRSRSSFASPATNAPNCSATSTRSSSRPKAPGQTERMENALLRERINDIAAEVAKLAMQLEGPNSAIEAMLAAEPAVPKTPAKPANDVAGAPPAVVRRRRHARRTHPRAAVARLPRPPAGGVIPLLRAISRRYGSTDRLTLRARTS